MRNSNNAARRENKKALPKFILIVVCSLILGGALGLLMVKLSLEDFDSTLDAAARFFTVRAAGWLIIALPVVELAACLPLYVSAKKQLALWDGEDEAVSGGIEVRISVCVWITSLFTVLAFFLLAALFSGLAASAGAPPKIPAPLFFGALAAFLAALFASIVLQQKLVDLAKQLNPEKEGSVYDTRFQKKWFESCDEAERAIIGQCAFKAYQAMCRMCLVLWAVFALGGIFFSWGFLPAMAVCVVWAAGQSVYARWTLKLGRPAGKV